MKILILDDQAVVRTGLAHVLKEIDRDVSVVEADGVDAAGAALSGAPGIDLVIADVFREGARADDALNRLDRAAPDIPVVVFSALRAPEDMIRVIRRGARAFLPKDSPAHLIAGVVRLVLSGGFYVPPEVLAARDSLSGARPGAGVQSGDTRIQGLSRRQREILGLLAEGLSNQEIGTRLVLSLSTVKSHVTAILKTLGVKSRTQAVLLAWEAAGEASFVDRRQVGDRRYVSERRRRSERSAGEEPVSPVPTPSEIEPDSDGELARISHELRTSLTSIIGFSELIGDEVHGPLGEAKYGEYAKDIRASGARVLEVVSHALEQGIADRPSEMGEPAAGKRD